MKIYTEVRGKGQPIVVLHGGGCNHNHMLPIVEHLSKNFHVINVNLPGAGESEWHNITDMHDIADSILTVLPENAIYIGWSFGGLVAASIAARYPARIKQLIGITTTPKFVEDDHWFGIPKPGFKAGFNVSNQQDFEAILTSFIDNEFVNINPKPACYYQLDKINKVGSKRNIDILKQSINIVDATDFRSEYQAITCPIDLFFGGSDGCIPKSAYANIQSLNKNIVIHVIPNAQHMIFWTHKEEFFGILDDVLRNE